MCPTPKQNHVARRSHGHLQLQHTSEQRLHHARDMLPIDRWTEQRWIRQRTLAERKLFGDILSAVCRFYALLRVLRKKGCIGRRTSLFAPIDIFHVVF